jgi:hypothetical protein
MLRARVGEDATDATHPQSIYPARLSHVSDEDDIIF